MNGDAYQQKVLVTNPEGLHMRPAAAFAQMASGFQGDVTVFVDGKSANGKSVWDLMALGVLPGSELTVQVNGPDAETTLRALVDLLNARPREEVNENATG